MSIRHPRIQARFLALIGLRHASLVLLRIAIEQTVRRVCQLDPRCPVADCFNWLRKNDLISGRDRNDLKRSFYVCSQAAHGVFIEDIQRKQRKAFRVSAMVARLRGAK